MLPCDSDAVSVGIVKSYPQESQNLGKGRRYAVIQNVQKESNILERLHSPDPELYYDPEAKVYDPHFTNGQTDSRGPGYHFFTGM